MMPYIFSPATSSYSPFSHASSTHSSVSFLAFSFFHPCRLSFQSTSRKRRACGKSKGLPQHGFRYRNGLPLLWHCDTLFFVHFFSCLLCNCHFMNRRGAHCHRCVFFLLHSLMPPRLHFPDVLLLPGSGGDVLGCSYMP